MRIITPGVPPNIEKEVTCKRCTCKFAYTQDDVKTETDGPYHSSYVVCPCCGEFIYNEYSPLHRF